MAQRLAALIRGGIIGAVIICGTPIHPFACQAPVQGQQANTGELKLTPEEEKDSYDIYSMLLISYRQRRQDQTRKYGLSNRKQPFIQAIQALPA